MSNFKFELNKEGVKELLRGAEMQSVIDGAAKNIANTASNLASGLPFEAETRVGKTRVWAKVRPGDAHARRKNLKDNILEKAERSVTV